MPSLARLTAFVVPLLAVVNAFDYVCFQDCANTNYQGFPCPGLDLACYCGLDNGQFIGRLDGCIRSRCNQDTQNTYNSMRTTSPCATGGGAGGNDDNNDDDSTTATLTVSEVDTQTITATGDVTITTSLSLIGEDFTSTIVQTLTTQTVITTESDTTRTFVVTATLNGTGNGNETSTNTDTAVVTSIPTSTVLTTVTSGDTTITSGVSTLFRTSTVPRSTTTATSTSSGSGSQPTGSVNQGGVIMAVAAGLFAIAAM